MSPTRVSKNGPYRFDRRFRGIGRVQASSGTRSLREFRRRDALLTKLYEQGRYDLLRALKAGTLTAGELINADRLESLAGLSGDPMLQRPYLAAARRAFDRDREITDDTRTQYKGRLAALERAGALTASSRVSDLARLDWRDLEAAWGRSPAHWNQTRRAISRSLTLLLGDEAHPFRRDVVKAIPQRVELPREPDVTPETFRRVVGEMPEAFRCYFWVIAGLGLRMGELMQLRREHLMPETMAVKIGRRRRKNRYSIRTLPVHPGLWRWLTLAVPVAFTSDRLRDVLRRACVKAKVAHIRPHDLRHCFGQWSAEAGVEESQVQKFMGHATADMTRLYRQRALNRSTGDKVAEMMGVPQVLPQRDVTDRHA